MSSPDKCHTAGREWALPDAADPVSGDRILIQGICREDGQGYTGQIEP
jgi:hypothetical protein